MSLPPSQPLLAPSNSIPAETSSPAVPASSSLGPLRLDVNHKHVGMTIGVGVAYSFLKDWQIRLKGQTGIHITGLGLGVWSGDMVRARM